MKLNRVPTRFWMNASGNRAASAWVARQPVQCVGTRKWGENSASASHVGPMIGSNAFPPRRDRFHLAAGAQGRASKTRLKGVWAAWRKRLKPASAMTWAILAGPAWAPSARPTSCESDAGVHSSVEKP